MVEELKTGPGIRVIPPIVYLVGFAIGYLLERQWPIVEVRWQWTIGLAAVAICASVLLVVPSIASFRRRATPFDVRKPASALVTDGPYRHSRNPGYLALTLLYFGLAVIIGSVWTLIVLVAVIVVMHYAVVLKEEKHLEVQFGEEYVKYKAEVRRWL